MLPLRARAVCTSLAALLLACAPAEKAATDSAGAAAPATTDVATVRAVIEEANAKWAGAMVAADVPTIVANYADDGVMMQPGMPAVSGRAAVEEAIKGMLASMKVDSASFTTNDVKVGGDMAIETGSFRMTMTPKGGKPTNDVGKYVTVWQKQADGSWKVIRDISNSDVAAPTK